MTTLKKAAMTMVLAVSTVGVKEWRTGLHVPAGPRMSQFMSAELLDSRPL